MLGAWCLVLGAWCLVLGGMWVVGCGLWVGEKLTTKEWESETTKDAKKGEGEVTQALRACGTGTEREEENS